MTDNDFFYLDKIFPEAEKIFSFEYKSLDEIEKKCIFIFDTNVLFVPFDSSEKSIEEINIILKKLKKENRLLIPARVAREFANNRAKRIGDLFLKVRQIKDNLNSGNYKFDDYPLLEENPNYKEVKNKFELISKLIKESRNLLTNIETDIQNWNWDDNVSKMYKEIFSTDTIIELQKDKSELVKDLQFRAQFKVAPGYKDSGKIDDGIGDLIIWWTILEIAKDNDSDIIFVSNDQKNDWFYKQDKIGLYPKYELFDEFRRYTSGKSIHIINFLKFLELRNAKEETIKEIQLSIARNDEEYEYSREYTHSDLATGMIIHHKRFGKGIITKLYNSSKGKEWIQIEFENGIVKHFILKTSDLFIPKTPANLLRKLLKASFAESNLNKNTSIGDLQYQEDDDDEDEIKRDI